MAGKRVAAVVGAGEIAQLLGVSRQRVHELAQTHDDFPEPIARLSGRTPVWDRAQVENWAKQWQRKPGRPGKAENGS